MRRAIVFALSPTLLEGILPISLYLKASGGETRSLEARSDLPGGLEVLLTNVPPVTLPQRFENGETLMTYSPQRLLRQFLFD